MTKKVTKRKIAGRFLGRDVIERPSCPFCEGLIDQPRELQARMPHEMPVGKCACGAVYSYDVTGHNLGTAMIEALVFGCNGDWDLAWNLLPEDDYLEKMLKNYDLESHLIVHGGVYEGRRVAGTLYFVKLHGDIREVTEQGTQRQLDKATTVSQGASAQHRGRKSFTKREVEALVKSYDMEPLLRIAKEDKRIIRDVQRLIYSADKLLRWRAADTLGKVSSVIAQYDPGAISKLLQRLFTALTDTAASTWGALDAIGEIIRNRPEQFAGYIPQLYQFTGDRSLLGEVLRALGKIGKESPDLIKKKSFHFIPLLKDPDTEIRGYAAILLGDLRSQEARRDLETLRIDSAAMDIYRDGDLIRRTVGQLASEALEKL